MQVLITGGSGFVGRFLTDLLLQKGYAVTALGGHSHDNQALHPNYRYVVADTSKQGEWQKLVAEQDALINLAGRSVFHLWSDSYKKQIYDSRILTTRNLVEALPQDNGPRVLVSTSAAGFYGNGGEDDLDENAGPGHDFLARVCTDWESEARAAEKKGVRVALTRFGVVLGAGGGALQTMRLPFQLGLGGSIGSGKQWFPWIHLQNLAAAICWILEGEGLSGPFNCTAPESVRQKEFASSLGRALHRPAFLPTPAFLMTLLLGEFGASLLQGQKAVPAALLRSGFSFTFSGLAAALNDLV
ncbi:MAG: TIGR01777 family oxidoreductase [Proteobacteria bacterium]|nr:TIGR01777 family oxidoreductase [Pseudomonadota bacterium]MBU1417194.1 TIGR01777 family oxidoreductase [Pseudomonadota bacterium]MBU1453632.1 TIGR01777 family oxidoreductase [Pseudomonadota bacterium]